jgi:hypothetical protein
MLQNKVKMDEFYFKKYSRYVKHGEDIELFLTLKSVKPGVLIDIPKHHEKSLIRILDYYKMNYVVKRWENKKYLSFFISKKPISEENQKQFELFIHSNNFSIKLGNFLGYPYPLDMGKINREYYGFVIYRLTLDKKESDKKIQFITYRVPGDKMNAKLFKYAKSMLRKYKKCIKDHLGDLYPHFKIEVNFEVHM